MRPTVILSTGIAAAALAGCASMGGDLEPPPPPLSGMAEAEVREPGGRVVAEASAMDVGDSIRIRVEAAGLAPGIYAVHVHETGRCDAPGFESAGGHWNPTNRQHGSQNPQGQHKGDLPNLQVGQTGQGWLEYTIPNASVMGDPYPMLDADGAAIVVHASADDYRTNPSGNSGARIACGVVRA